MYVYINLVKFQNGVNQDEAMAAVDRYGMNHPVHLTGWDMVKLVHYCLI